MKSTPTVPGSRYGRLTVLTEAAPLLTPRGARRRCWFCRCDCGAETVVRQEFLRGGVTRSCGCLRTEAFDRNRRTIHGMWLSEEFRIWSRMLERCSNPHHQAYHRYGGRGIAVCERWRLSFLAFFEDMGRRPSPKHTLNRIDNDGGYSPENCQWATVAEQNQNRANNRNLTFQGETLCVSEWARRTGIRKETLRQRLKAGWSVERTLTEPLNR